MESESLTKECWAVQRAWEPRTALLMRGNSGFQVSNVCWKDRSCSSSRGLQREKAEINLKAVSVDFQGFLTKRRKRRKRRRRRRRRKRKEGRKHVSRLQYLRRPERDFTLWQGFQRKKIAWHKRQSPKLLGLELWSWRWNRVHIFIIMDSWRRLRISGNMTEESWGQDGVTWLTSSSYVTIKDWTYVVAKTGL